MVVHGCATGDGRWGRVSRNKCGALDGTPVPTLRTCHALALGLRRDPMRVRVRVPLSISGSKGFGWVCWERLSGERLSAYAAANQLVHVTTARIS